MFSTNDSLPIVVGILPTKNNREIMTSRMLRRLPISEGRVPWIGLTLMWSFSSDRSLPNSVGIVPVIRQLDKFKTLRLVSRPISVGILPDNRRLDDKSKSLSEVNIPISVGIVPEKICFRGRERTSRWESLPSIEGIPMVARWFVAPVDELEHATAPARSIFATLPFTHSIPARAHSCTFISTHVWYWSPQLGPSLKRNKRRKISRADTAPSPLMSPTSYSTLWQVVRPKNLCLPASSSLLTRGHR
mmetsp:Transcript_31744/g.72926  ORF Transcript_31744/g.72926 Transcript_31744/m.72926 type:complete len:246 (-) Transcript_31744:259-996(-)